LSVGLATNWAAKLQCFIAYCKSNSSAAHLGGRHSEILERAHPVEMISKVSLGSLLDLFLTVDEFDARYDFGEQFRAVEPAPMLLGFQAEFKYHGQCRDS
jgi:hypothetical protein